MAKIIDGKQISLEIKNQLKEKVLSFTEKFNRKIRLAVLLVGENPASKVYVKNKITAAEFVGIESLAYYLPEDSTEQQVKDLVITLSNDNSVDGILVQLPLPKHIDQDSVLNLIPADKDVDGFLPENLGNLAMGTPSTISCTPFGVMKLLKYEGIELSGKNAVVVGRSNIVGKPMAMLLLNENCTVTVCHSKTNDLAEICKKADILVAAIGKPKFITENMIKEGAILIDVGINRTENGLVGDIDFENVKNKASYITPVPGGVGPMTIAMLMENTYNSAVRRQNAL